MAVPELAKFSPDPRENTWFVDLGRRDSHCRYHQSNRCYLREMTRDGTENQIRVKGWTNLRSVNWAGNGNSLFVGTGGEGTTLRVDFRGNAAVLQKDCQSA